MLAFDNMPQNRLTLGTTESGGHTTLGDLNCTWEGAVEAPLDATLALGNSVPIPRGTLLLLLVVALLLEASETNDKKKIL